MWSILYGLWGRIFVEEALLGYLPMASYSIADQLCEYKEKNLIEQVVAGGIFSLMRWL